MRTNITRKLRQPNPKKTETMASKARSTSPPTALAKMRYPQRTIRAVLQMLAESCGLANKAKPTVGIMDTIHEVLNYCPGFHDEFMEQLNDVELEGLKRCNWEALLARLLAEWIYLNPAVAKAMDLDRETRLGMVKQTFLIPKRVWANYLEANKASGRPRNVELDIAHILQDHSERELVGRQAPSRLPVPRAAAMLC